MIPAAILLLLVLGAVFMIFLKRRVAVSQEAVNRPRKTLIEGTRILNPVLRPKGFSFHLRSAGTGSGGPYAYGEFVRKNQRLELHFRMGLGLVRYHIGEQSASHESYMRELGVWDGCKYPNFSADPMAGFETLAADLRMAEDFLDGPGSVLMKAAEKESAIAARENADEMAQNAGDYRKRDELRRRFHEKNYMEVLLLASQLRYPDRMPEAERRMIEMAQKRSGQPT